MESQFDIVLNVLVAMLVGAAIGLEREIAQKPAGLRTHILVAGAAALLVMMGDAIVTQFHASEPAGAVRADPIRIIQAIIIGVSFLGTGTIFKASDDHVVGLTTAASLLFTVTLGIAVALGFYVVAFGLAIVTVLMSRMMAALELRINGRRSD